MGAQIGFVDALRRVFPTTVTSHLGFHSWIQQETLRNRMNVDSICLRRRDRYREMQWLGRRRKAHLLCRRIFLHPTNYRQSEMGNPSYDYR